MTVGVEVANIIPSDLDSCVTSCTLQVQRQMSRFGGGLHITFAFSLAVTALLTTSFFDLHPVEAQTAANAQSRRTQEQAENDLVRQVTVTVHKSRTIRLDQPFEKAVVGSPDIIDALPTNNQTLYLQGKKAGTTNVSIFDNAGRLIEVFDISVTPDTGSLQEKIRSGPGSRGIIISSANGQVILSGTAADAAAADRAVSIAKQLNPEGTVINTMLITPAASQQVMLKVQFLEASRTAARELGVNLYGNGAGQNGPSRFNTGTQQPTTSNSTGSPFEPLVTAGTMLSGATPFGVVLANVVNRGGKIDAMVSALETQGLVRRLAEPTLMALSGDSASFLAGGEFPVPVPQPGSTGGVGTFTIEFKRFGVQLGFQPTVLANGVINLRLTPSVSEIDPNTSVTILGTSVPGLVTREARTTVELRDGQSFAIAGLLSSDNKRSVAQLPWIGSVPVLGTLFRSASYQQNETDLVVIVTPHLVAPSTPEQRLASPLDQRIPSNDLDFFLLGQMELRKRYTDYVTSGGTLNGPYGHMIRGSE
jgi:pilus assembly protein CpaC